MRRAAEAKPAAQVQAQAQALPVQPAVGYGRGGATCVRRKPENMVLHRVVREHLETFLAEVELRGGGQGVPRFVERELREFLNCGGLARGFARFRCGDCGREILVAFSCKGRGFCPSCCGRRMAERAAHVVDGVLGGLPVRQWVLTVPYRPVTASGSNTSAATSQCRRSRWGGQRKMKNRKPETANGK